MEDTANNSNCPQVRKYAYHDCTVYSALHVNKLTAIEKSQRYTKKSPAVPRE